MTDHREAVAVCPPALFHEALGLVLRELSPDQRRDVAAGIEPGHSPPDTLLVAMRDGQLVDAAWGQPQPGNTAIFWPPERTDATARQLTQAVAESLDRHGVSMTQVLVADRTAAAVPVLEAAGFEHLAELLYLTWETSAAEPPTPANLEFQPYDESQLARLTQLTDATYAGTQDCPAMNGRRPMHEVLEGYRATGRFRPENWRFVRADGEDVGVLLLAEHGGGSYWELVYMGLVPERRGRAWGREIVRFAQRFVVEAGAERLLVAVDAANAPALKLYQDAGFLPWDCRTVFVRFRN